MVGAMSSYFVTGVSGALASHVVPQISARGATVSVTGVDRSPLSTSSPKLRFVQQDLEGCDLTELLEGIDVVLHLASSAAPSAVQKLLDAAFEKGVRQVVILSSATVFGAWRTNPVPLADDAPLRPNPGFSYAVRLAETERVVDEWKAAHPEACIAVLRMAMVLGGGLEEALVAALGGVEAHREIDSSRPVQFLHIEDAASAITFVIDHCLDGVYNVAPNGFVGDAKARAVAGSPPRPGLPRRIAWIANDATFRRRYRYSYAAAEPYLKFPWVMSNDRLRSAGWNPSYTSEEALVAEADPTWWGGLGPVQRRTVISGGVVVAFVGIVFSVLAGVGLVAKRRVRR